MRRSIKWAALVAASGLIMSACATGDDEENGDGEERSLSDPAVIAEECDPLVIEADAQVALAYDVGGRGDQSFNDAAYAGLDQAQDELQVTDIAEGEAATGEDNAVREDRLRSFAEDGFNTIIGVGFAYSEAVNAVAPDYEDVAFAVVDGFHTGDQVLCNVAYLGFAEHEGSFLVGAAAALESETDHIGFVGGVNNPLIQRFEAGYVAGAEAVNPDIQIDVVYIEESDVSGFQDPAGGKSSADGIYADGADIIFHAAGGSGSGVFDSAVENDAWAIGVDSDQYLTASAQQQSRIITSMLKRVDNATFQFIESVVNGETLVGDQQFPLADDGVGYSTSGDFLADETITQLEDYREQIIAGDIEVPDTP